MTRYPIHINIRPDFKPGDPAPEGYLDWHEWARIQIKAGLRQVQCGKCQLWKFPQELSAETVMGTVSHMYRNRPRSITGRHPVCKECANEEPVS